MNLTEHQFKEFTDVLCSALEKLDCAQKTHCVKVTPVQQANVNGGAADFDVLDFAQVCHILFMFAINNPKRFLIN